MSIASAQRPSTLPFSNPSPTTRSSVGRETIRQFHHESNYLNLTRMLMRYQHLILLVPDSSSEVTKDLTPLQRQIQAELWSPLPYHRTKWLRNIEGARNLLLQLERAAQNIKVQRSKQTAQRDLAEKRTVIKKLRNRVEEIGREVEGMGEEAWKLSVGNSGEGDTVMEILQRRSILADARKDSRRSADSELREGKPVREVVEDTGFEQNQEGDTEDHRDSLFNTSSTIRRRAGQGSAATTSPPAQATGSSGMEPNERALLDSSRTQEDLTSSLVSMAAQLKQQTRAFQFSLDQDKGLLNRALEGLDRNLSGMEAASKNMAFLKRMSEGEGWIGRLKLYAMIFGMWMVAFLLVFIGPKLRF